MMSASAQKILLAIVGMPGAGKTEATQYLKKKGIPFVRFGDVTERELTERGLPLTPENERIIRESLRTEFGMAAYAIRSKPFIDQLISHHACVILDGLYSWEEYVYLKAYYPHFLLVHVYAEPKKRYERLSKRPVRPFTPQQARDRDIAEIEKLNKGGPIAIADYCIENTNDSIPDFFKKIDALLARLHQ